ncbi:radical SAM protein [Candidatus Fermentibacteria bacterium]|nr:radical SAM protein [Candidatus Fermentibacteria bacterium]
MRIILAQAPAGRPEPPVFPLGLAFLAGQLKGHDIRAIDLALHRDPAAALRRAVGSFDPDVIGFSLRNIDDSSYPITYSYFLPFGEVVRSLEDWNGTVVVGGTGFSIYPRQVMQRAPRVDYGIVGEAELEFPGLMERIEKETVPRRAGGTLLKAGHVDLSRLDSPAYEVFDIEPYRGKRYSVGVQSRRGCPMGCTYCTYGYLGGRAFRRRPIESVVDDIATLERLGLASFAFVDSLFNEPRDYFHALLEAIAESGTELRWSCWIDESVTPADLERMVEAGARKVDFSPDAITDRGSSLLGKRAGAGRLFPIVRQARKAGLFVGVNFFNNNPGEGLGALLRKLLFTLRARLLLGWRNTVVNIGTIRVYDHSKLAEEMRDQGLVEQDCDFFEPVFYSSPGPADWLYRALSRLRRLRHGGG